MTETNRMNAKEAVFKLREMQRQVVHGSNLFGDIADCIVQLEQQLEDPDKEAQRVTDGCWLPNVMNDEDQIRQMEKDMTQCAEENRLLKGRVSDLEAELRVTRNPDLLALDYTLSDIPIDVIEAACKVSLWMEQNGHEDWIIGGVQSAKWR